MNEVDYIKNLARTAKDEQPTGLADVSDAVLRNIRRGRPVVTPRIWTASAVAAVLIATITLGLAANDYASLDNPLSDWMAFTSAVSQ